MSPSENKPIFFIPSLKKWIPFLKNKWVIGSCITIILFFLIALFFQARKIQTILKEQIQIKLAEQFPGHEIKIDSIYFLPYNKIIVSNLKLSNQNGFSKGSFVQIEKIRIRLRLSYLYHFIRQQFSRSDHIQQQNPITVIEIIYPSIQFNRIDGIWNLPQMKKSENKPLPIIKIKIKNGKIKINDDQNKLNHLNIPKIDGDFYMDPQKSILNFELITEKKGECLIQASINEKKEIQSKIILKNIPNNWIIQNIEPLQQKQFLGSSQSETTLSAVIPKDWKKIKNWNYQGNIHLETMDSAFVFETSTLPFKTKTNIDFSNFSITVKSFLLQTTNSEIQSSGSIKDFLSDKKIQMNSHMKIDVNEISPFFNLTKERFTQGTLNANLNYDETFSTPMATAELSLENAQLYGEPINSKFKCNISSNILNINLLDIQWGETKILSSGIFNPEKMNWNLMISQLKIDRFDKNKKIKGTLHLKVKGLNKNIHGFLDIKSLQLGNEYLGQLQGPINASLQIFKMNLKSPDSRNKCSIQIEKNLEDIQLKNGTLVLKNESIFNISGQLNLVTKEIKGKLNISSVPTEILSPFIYFMSRLNGKVSLKGEVSGSGKDPQLNGYLSAIQIGPKLQLPGENISEKFNSTFFWNKEKIELTQMKLGNTIQGSVTYLKKPMQQLDLSIQMTEAYPKTFLAFLNSSTQLSGKLSGKLNLIYKKYPIFKNGEKYFHGFGNLSINDGMWGSIPFQKILLDVRSDLNELKINHFRILQEKGELSASAESPQTFIKNPLQGRLNLKNFIVSKNKLNGIFKINGDWELQESPGVSLFLESNEFFFNKFSAGGISGWLTLKDKVLHLKNISWGNFFNGQLKIFYDSEKIGDSPKLLGEWKSTINDIKKWGDFFDMEFNFINGLFSLSGNISGTIEQMKFDLFSNTSQLKLNPKNPENNNNVPDVFWEGKAQATFTDHALKSLSIQLKAEEKSELIILGQANTQSQMLSLKTSYKDVDLASILQIFTYPVLKGKSDGQLSVEGNWNNPIIKGAISGGNGTLGSIPIDKWNLEGTYRNKEFLFDQMNFYGYRGSWRFSMTDQSWIQLGNNSNMGSYQLHTDFANISLGPIHFVGNGTANGNWKKTADSVFQYDAMLKIKECTANDLEIEPSQLKIQYVNKKLTFFNSDPIAPESKAKHKLSGSVDFSKLPCAKFENFSISQLDQKLFSIHGDYCNDQPNFNAEGRGVDASILSGILDSPITFQGKTFFDIQGHSKNKTPTIEGTIKLFNGKVEEIPVDELSAQIQWKKGLLYLNSFSLKTKNYLDLSAKGYLPLKWGEIQPDRSKMDLEFQCKNTDLSFINFIKTDWIKGAKGPVSAELKIQGNPDQPKINGSLQMNNVEWNSRYFTKKLKNLNFKANIQSNRVKIEKFQGAIGEGLFKVIGSFNISWEQGELIFDQYKLQSFTTDKKGLDLQIPELPAIKEKLGLPAIPSKGEVLFDLHLTGTKEIPQVTGWVQLDQTQFSYPPPPKEKTIRTSFHDIFWDIELRTGKRVIFQNDFVYAVVNGKLKIKNNLDHLQVNGKMVSNDGTISAYGAKFDLREATLEVIQPTEFNLLAQSTTEIRIQNLAYLQLKAEQNTFTTSAQGEKISDTITLNLERTPLNQDFDSKKLTFRSSQSPQLSSEKVATKAGLGIDLETAKTEDKEIQLRQGIAKLLDAQLATPLAHALLQRTGLIHKIEISQDTNAGRNPELRGEEKSAIDPLIGQSILIERTFGSKLGIGYKATVDKIKDKADLVHQLQLRYPFYKGFWLYGSRELDSKDNLGRDPESKAGVEWRIRFSVSDLFKKSKNK